MSTYLAALVTTVVPAAIGTSVVKGPMLIRFGLGGILGIAVMGIGAGAGAILGSASLGAGVGLMALFLVGRLYPLQFPDRKIQRWLLIAIALAGSAMLFLSLLRSVPGADAIWIWTLKAKGLATFQDLRNPVFLAQDYSYSQQDYPPLLPAWQSLAYTIQGSFGDTWPLQFQMGFIWVCGLACLAAIFGGDHPRLLPLSVVWITSPQVVRSALTGYADMMMAVFLVLALTLVAIEDDASRQWPSALLLAAAAATKNEGFVLALLVAAFAWVAGRPRRNFLTLFLAPTLAFGLWRLFIHLNGISGDPLLGAIPSDWITRLPEVGWGLVKAIFRPKDWLVLVPLSLATMIITKSRAIQWMPFALGIGLFAFVYVLTSLDLPWLISTSADRVVMAPLGFLAVTGAVRNHGGEVASANGLQRQV